MKMSIKSLFAVVLILTVSSILAQEKFTPQAFYTKDASGMITGFTFPALPYSYNALQPSIDSLTMSIHYDRHHRAYYNNFISLAKELKLMNKSLDEIFASMSKYPEGLRNNGGGYYNHTLFWENMSPAGGGKPAGKLAAAIDKAFGSFDSFKQVYSTAAKGKFGSGWAWLILNDKKELQVVATSNQDNPLMDVSVNRGTPLLALDVWEHAYYLKYQNKRAEYVEAFWNLVNWKEVDRRYSNALGEE